LAHKAGKDRPVTTSLGPEPSYCKVHLGALTPSEWTTCWKYGWDQPTTLVTRIGYDFGHNVLPVLIIVAVIVLLVMTTIMSRN
jgi:hypothetical protein